MKKLFLFAFLATALTGCAFFDQAKQDYQLHKETPYAADETTPQQKTQILAGTVSSIPYANLSAPLILLAGPYFFGWLRGRRIRRETLAEHPHPITGSIGQTVGLEAIVQHLATVAAGLFEVGANGTAFKRGWKITLLTALGAIVAPGAEHVISEIIPVLQSNPPAWLANLFNGGILALVIGGLAAAEKWLSKVQPVKEPVATLAVIQ